MACAKIIVEFFSDFCDFFSLKHCMMFVNFCEMLLV